MHVTSAFWSDSVRRTAACYSWATYGDALGSLTTSCQSFIGTWNPAVEIPPSCSEFNSVSGDKFFICRPNSGNIVYVAVKGSDGADWSSPTYGNTAVGPIPFPRLKGGHFFGGSNSVHQGFGNAWVASREGLFAAMHNACSTGCQVVLTGHSRGGSIAGLAFFNFILEWVKRPGQYDFSHIYLDPAANVRVITFGEGFAADFESMVSTNDYTRIAAVQNTLKERWISCDSLCATCDPVTWVGSAAELNDFGKIVKSCNGLGGHSMQDHYLHPFFMKNEVDRLSVRCVKASDNTGGDTFTYNNCGVFSGCGICGDDTTCTSRWNTQLTRTCPLDPALPAPEPQPSYMPPPFTPPTPPPQPTPVSPPSQPTSVPPSTSTPTPTPAASQGTPPGTEPPASLNSAASLSIFSVLILSVLLL